MTQRNLRATGSTSSWNRYTKPFQKVYLLTKTKNDNKKFFICVFISKCGVEITPDNQEMAIQGHSQLSWCQDHHTHTLPPFPVSYHRDGARLQVPAMNSAENQTLSRRTWVQSQAGPVPWFFPRLYIRNSLVALKNTDALSVSRVVRISGSGAYISRVGHCQGYSGLKTMALREERVPRRQPVLDEHELFYRLALTLNKFPGASVLWSIKWGWQHLSCYKVPGILTAR